MNLLQVFILLLLAGLLLIGAEVFIPGGILGVIGLLALIGSCIVAFLHWPPAVAGLISGAILIVLAVVLYLWVRLFPKSRLGRQMTVETDLAAARTGTPDLQGLVGKEGETRCDLRPAGYALIDGKRLDVVSEGAMIAKDVRVKVVQVVGNRIVVRKA